MLKNNPDFKEVFTHQQYRLYIPESTTKYHTCRLVQANNLLIFASSGATAEVIQAHTDKIIEYCNVDRPPASFRTDIAAIANALSYRTKSPVDEKVSIKMGALLCFMEFEKDGETISEDPDVITNYWADKKLSLAAHPDVYSFFLSWGISNIPKYRELLDTLKAEDYFHQRRDMLQSLLPENLQPLALL